LTRNAYLADSDAWRGGLELVEEELEVADDDELSHPALLDAAGLGHLDVALVGGADAARGVDPQRPLGCNTTEMYLQAALR
jgi:hypothetical protein